MRGKTKETWAMLMMNCRNLGCKPASFLRRLAIGLQKVLSARVPSLNTGRIISLRLCIYLFILLEGVIIHQLFDLLTQRI